MVNQKQTATPPTTLLKVIVGSHAHGLATATSDLDYRGVFVHPTSELLKLGERKHFTSWTEGTDDDTSWEVGHFLFLATKSNPTILETFLAPRLGTGNVWGDQLRELFPYVWSSKGVRDSFIGYGINQRKKFLENKDNRRAKYAAAYLRVLYNAWELLGTGTFTVRIADTPIGNQVGMFKAGHFTLGEVIDTCESWQEKVDEAYQANPDKQMDLERVNDLLLTIRKEFWE